VIRFDGTEISDKCHLLVRVSVFYLGDKIIFMSKYFNAGLVLLYVVLTIFCFLLVLAIAGMKIPDVWGWSIVAGWVLLCFGSAYLFTGVTLFFGYRLRRPIRVEEEKLGAAFREVQERAGYNKEIILRIEENKEYNAFATGTRTIAVSKGLLAELTDEELKGVLAHELGHLVSYDTVMASAFVTAGYLPRIVRFAYRIGAFIVRSGFVKNYTLITNRGMGEANRFSLVSGIITILVFGVVLYLAHLLQAAVPVILFVLLFGILHFIYRVLLLLLSRLAEYRQDAFAARLGFGTGLRDTLEKLAGQTEPDVNPYYIMFKSTHPVIYNRIRRLEKMGGS
jgi:Zn-dependent protease with chaperone function